MVGNHREDTGTHMPREASYTPDIKLNEAVFLPCSQGFGAWCVWTTELLHIHNATVNNCALQPDF